MISRTIAQVLRTSFILPLLALSVYSDDLQTVWQKRKTSAGQQQLIESVFPGQLGQAITPSGASARWGTALFPKGSQWVQLSPTFIPLPSSEKIQTLLFTVALRKSPAQEPYSMATYVLQGDSGRAELLSTGFAAKESLQFLSWPNQQAPFILLKSLMADDPPTASFLLYRAADIQQTSHATPIWSNKPSRDYIELGVANHGSNNQLYLVERRQIGKAMTKSDQGKSSQLEFKIYHWTGLRFEEDSIVFDAWLKALPEKTWDYKPPAL